MKYLILCVLSLFAYQAEAQLYGCFSSNTASCTQRMIQCSGTYNNDVALYGESIANLCYERDEGLSNWFACDETLQEWKDYGNECYASNTAGRKLLNRYQRLERRLRKACGAQCKKLKL